jgi:hypothetical protein
VPSKAVGYFRPATIRVGVSSIRISVAHGSM